MPGSVRTRPSQLSVHSILRAKALPGISGYLSIKPTHDYIFYLRRCEILSIHLWRSVLWIDFTGKAHFIRTADGIILLTGRRDIPTCKVSLHGNSTRSRCCMLNANLFIARCRSLPTSAGPLYIPNLNYRVTVLYKAGEGYVCQKC
jgi:hypothetical protein